MFFLLFLVLINPRTQRSWRGKCLFLVTAFNTHKRKSRKEIHEVTWQQELKQRLQRKVAYWLALHGLPILLSYTVMDHLSMPPLRVAWALLDRYYSRKCLIDLPTGNGVETITYSRFLLLRRL